MKLKHFWQSGLIYLLLLWIGACIFIRPGWIIFSCGCFSWLALVWLTAPGVFWTYFAFINNRPEVAMTRLRKAVSYRPAIPYPYFTLGMMTAKQNRWSEAISFMEQAIFWTSPSKTYHYRIVLSEAYRESGAFEKSISILQELAQEGMVTDKLYTDLAITYLKIPNYVNALENAEKARSLDTSAVQPVLIMGKAHFGLGHYQEAKNNYEWAMSHITYPVESYYWIGRCELELGNQEKAVQHLQSAIERIGEDPLLSDITLEEAKEWLEIAQKE